ncbi:MAG: hypothetical protein QNI99_20090 [Woeseiaceae bacterium]|nr:hypothetical protein [Woeseiaceae bacterium]
MITILPGKRIEAAKRAFSTRRVSLAAIKGYIDHEYQPNVGDVVLARVEEVGRLERIELPCGRKSRLYEGDEVLLAYGNRYAPDAYEALMPRDLGPCDLAAAGGLAATIVETNLLFADEDRPPTSLAPIGVCVDHDGHPINVAGYGLGQGRSVITDVPVITVFGSSMNSGKTTTAAGLIRGLAQQGLTVGAAKITGTCSGGDLWKFLDAGCYRAYDFTDVGMATTYKESTTSIVAGAQALVSELEADDCDVIVMEIADGIHQEETAALLNDQAMRLLVDHWVYAADSASAVNLGARIAKDIGLPLRCISGAVTASPLAVREASNSTEVPMLGLDELESGEQAMSWIDPLRRYADVPIGLYATQMQAF